MRAVLIANPQAGRNRAVQAAEQARQVFRAAGWDVEVRLTGCPGDAVRIAAEAAAEGFDAVFACGGDGCLAEAANGSRGTQTAVGVVPAGTGNDFARHIGLPLEPARAAQALLQGAPHSVDMLQLNDGRPHALNVLGMGLDSRVAERINRRCRLVSGTAAYISALVAELWRYEAVQAHIEVDGEQWSGRILLVAVANATSYGGGMKVSPLSQIADGLLEVVALEYIPRMQFLRHFPRVFRGTHLSIPAVHHWQGRHVRLETGEPVPVSVDGDVMGHTPLEATVLPGAVNMWLPRVAISPALSPPTGGVAAQ